MTSDRRHGAGSSRGKSASVAEKVAKKVNAKTSKLDRVVEKVNAKAGQLDRVAVKVNAKAEKLDRIAAKAAQRADALERLSTGLGALDLWTRAEPTSRRPRFSREEITATAVRIADSEGFDALSMRRLAVELDAGTMTLYHYVRTKDELLTLVVDAVMGEVVLGPDETMPTHWRDAMTRIAEKTRAAVLRHQWVLDLNDDPPLGPNSVRHFDQSLQAVASLPITLAERLDICAVVDEYVFGACLHERHADPGPQSPDPDTIDYVNGLVATGGYPQLAAMVAEYGSDGAWEQIERFHADPGRFARNLRRLLDGIEAELPAEAR